MEPRPKHDGPLVSVMMPAYNAGPTIRFALASLIAQTYENWECVVVDDGSTDDTFERACSIGDPRIHVFRLEPNRGEAAARQRALQESRGEVLGMLDADDWFYPDKLERQVEALSANPDVSLVGCGMAISGRKGILVGVRAQGTGEKRTYLRPGRIPVAHAPSLFRRRDAGDISYDPHLKSAPDADFLRRLMLGGTYIVTPHVGYCYREIASASLKKILAGHYYYARGLAKFLRLRPIPVGWELIQEMGKIVVYVMLAPFGLFKFLVRKRSRPPDENERAVFSQMKAAVQAVNDNMKDGTAI